jgi:Protein of unknown function (DUF3352)
VGARVAVTLSRVRRLLFAALAVLAAGLVAGCGSSRTTGAPSPTLQTLSYFPSTASFVLTVQTDPKSPGIKNTRALEQHFPQAALLQTALFTRLGQLGIDYNKQVRPLFGNPVAFGVLSARASGSQTPFLSAWVTRSQSALAGLIEKLGPALKSNGMHDGAKLYTVGGGTLAIAGPTVLIARSPQDVDAALDRHKSAQGISPSQYAKLTTGLAGGSLMQMFGDLTQALAAPQAAQARRVPWVAAIKSYSASINATPSAMMIRFHLNTTGRSLTASQLPLAAGSSPPAVAGTAPIQMGLRNLAQSIQFLEAAEQASEPARYAKFTTRLGVLKRRTGFDLQTFVAMLTGTLDISSDTETTIGRVAVRDPASVTAMLKRLAGAPGLAFSEGTQIRSLGGGFYAIHERSGSDLTLGVVANQLMLGKATPTQIRVFARAPTAPVPGAAGAAAFRIGLQDLLHLTLTRAPSPAAQQLLNVLGDVTGSVSATTSGLDGRATLALK